MLIRRLKMNKKVAVIILNWNGAALLRRYLPTVCATTNSELADVIVADNGSTDNSLAVLADEFPQVKVIKFSENYGFAEGYNHALDATRYPYTVLLNSDVATSPGWVEPLLSYCESHPEVAVCQPKILSDVDHSRFEYAGAAGGFLDHLGYPYCRGRIFSTLEFDHGQYDGAPVDIFWASGAAFFVRTEVYQKAGGLDRLFFAHMEEIDLCWRIHRLGFAIRVIPQSRVYHLGGGSLPPSDPRKVYLNFRNNLLLMYKNLPRREGGRLLFIRRLYDTLALLMFLVKFDFGDAGAVIRAHRDFRKMRKNYNDFPAENILPSLPGTQRNIVIDYYLRHRTTF
jgi:GT2 family glycosyltransferase